MSEKYGIEELVKLATATAHTVTVIDSVLEDNQINFKDLAATPQLFGALREFTDVSFAKVVPQAMDISAEEAPVLAAHFKKVFALHNHSVEDAVETGLDIIIKGMEMFQWLRGAAAKIKGAVGA